MSWARLAGFACFAAVCFLLGSLYVDGQTARDERDEFARDVAALQTQVETQARRIDELTVLLADQQERSECLDVLEGHLEVALVARFEAVLDGDVGAQALTGEVVATVTARYLGALEGEFCPPAPPA